MLSNISDKMDLNNDLTFENALKSVTVLDAILWIGRAWDKISLETVQNCFVKTNI